LERFAMMLSRALVNSDGWGRTSPQTVDVIAVGATVGYSLVKCEEFSLIFLGIVGIFG
jgi:hypothetical protein